MIGGPTIKKSIRFVKVSVLTANLELRKTIVTVQSAEASHINHSSRFDVF